MAEKVLLNTPHVLSALSPANSRYSRPRRRPLRASGRLLRLAAEGDLVAPWRCSCTSRTLVSLSHEAKAAHPLPDLHEAWPVASCHSCSPHALHELSLIHI